MMNLKNFQKYNSYYDQNLIKGGIENQYKYKIKVCELAEAAQKLKKKNPKCAKKSSLCLILGTQIN